MYSMKKALLPLAGALALLGTTGPAAAQIDVAIVAAAATSSSDCSFTDVQAKLMATGQFNTVDIINVTSPNPTPTLAQLQNYDAVISWTNFTPTDFNAWGDVMADYVDAGGGVVVTVFANSSITPGRHLGGRWETGGYEVIVSQSGNCSGAAGLGMVHDENHPIMVGVTSFSGGSSSFRPCGTALTPGSSLIAEWTDGRVLVAVGSNPRRADLGFYPPSNACSSSFWDSSTDGARLMAQALCHVAGGGCCFPPATYCTAQTTTTGCIPAIGSSGIPTKSGGAGTFDVTLSDTRPNKDHIFFYSVNTGRSSAPFFGGTLCMTSPAGRTAKQRTTDTGECTSGVTKDFGAVMASTALITPGDVIRGQWWGRDMPGITNLSDAIEFLVCP